MTAVSSDTLDNLKAWQEENQFPFPILSDEAYTMLEAYGVYLHDDEKDPYEDEGKHGEPAVFLLDEENRLLYKQKQTAPFGRPSAKELRKIVSYIRKNKDS
ncbi:redoxin domain-containing protein [Alkalicoccus chagannorensis]